MKPFPLLREADGEHQSAFSWSDEIGESVNETPGALAAMRANGWDLKFFELDVWGLGVPESELAAMLMDLLDNGRPVDKFVARLRRWHDEYSSDFRHVLGGVIQQAYSAGYAAAKREER